MNYLPLQLLKFSSILSAKALSPINEVNELCDRFLLGIDYEFNVILSRHSWITSGLSALADTYYKVVKLNSVSPAIAVKCSVSVYFLLLVGFVIFYDLQGHISITLVFCHLLSCYISVLDHKCNVHIWIVFWISLWWLLFNAILK